MSGDAVEVFFSYSHKDEALRDQLATHLKLLERQGIIAAWHDRKIVPGSEWAGDIHNYLEQADIILLLISADFLASDYCWDVEIQKALERHEAGTTTVIPVILRPVDWSSAPFARLQALPKNAQPVVTWAPHDLAFMDIAKGIRLKAEELVATRQAQAAQAQRQAALDDYRQQLKDYLAAGPLSFIVKENLNDLAQTLGLSQADTAPIEAEETALRDAYSANLERYGETFRRALGYEYPLSDVTKTHLKDRQIVLDLNDQDVKQTEQAILADWQAQQLQNQRQQEQEAAAQRLREQEAERLRSKSESEHLRQQRAEVARRKQERQQRETAERSRQQQVEVAARQQQGQTGMSRRRALQWAGFGGGSLVLALGANSLLRLVQNGVSVEPATSIDLRQYDFEVVTVNETGEIIDRLTKQAQEFQEDLGNDVKLNMVEIPAGEFVMGSPPEGKGRDDEGPQRTVKVPRFFMGRFQVTQAQYEAVMGENPSRFQGAKRPVETVSWDDVMAFCEKLSELTGRTYRLPSEAEWEYSCRAGTTTPFHFGPTITTDLANYNGNYVYRAGPKGAYREQTTDVDSFPANAFGLYDMHGNVWEWCQDVYHNSYEGAPSDGSPWIEVGDQDSRVLRGGSWFSDPVYCRSAFRHGVSRDLFNDTAGFRVVWVPA